ncbi:NAD(P)-binding domain-containing protein [Caldalkalibacillus horti]
MTLNGRVFINLTSGTPNDARKAAQWVESMGADYLDGAIMGVPQMIGMSEALLFYGGSPKLFEAYEPLLKVFGGNTVFLSDDPGIPLLYDMALLTILYGAGEGLLHAHAMVSTANIPASQFQPYVAEWLTNVIVPSYASLDAVRAIETGEYATDVSNTKTNQLALGHIIKASKELDIPVEWLKPSKAVLDQLVDEGYSNDDPIRAFEIISPVRRKKHK